MRRNYQRYNPELYKKRIRGSFWSVISMSIGLLFTYLAITNPINKVEPSTMPPKASTMSKSDNVQQSGVRADVKPIQPIQPTQVAEPTRPVITKSDPYIPPAVNETQTGEVMPLSMERKTTKRPSLTFKTKEDIEVEQGVNEVISIAVSHLNRITTPFSNALVKTVDTGNVDVRGGILYVSTTKMIP